MRPKSVHEIGNVYAKAISNVPSNRWQEWELVKIMGPADGMRHVRLRERGGKTCRTVAFSILDDNAEWVPRETQPLAAEGAAAE
ncbi:MAG TPA: hypothetical protein VGL83_16005 [Stellaceae bacterium]|jgi:hypothetical protein